MNRACEVPVVSTDHPVAFVDPMVLKAWIAFFEP